MHPQKFSEHGNRDKEAYPLAAFSACSYCTHALHFPARPARRASHNRHKEIFHRSRVSKSAWWLILSPDRAALVRRINPSTRVIKTRLVASGPAMLVKGRAAELGCSRNSSPRAHARVSMHAGGINITPQKIVLYDSAGYYNAVTMSLVGLDTAGIHGVAKRNHLVVIHPPLPARLASALDAKALGVWLHSRWCTEGLQMSRRRSPHLLTGRPPSAFETIS